MESHPKHEICKMTITANRSFSQHKHNLNYVNYLGISSVILLDTGEYMPWSHVQWHRHFCKSMSDATRLRRYADCVLTVRANIRSLPNDIRLCSIVLSLLKTPLVQLVFIICITSEILKVVTKHVTTPRCNHRISTNIISTCSIFLREQYILSAFSSSML